MVHQPKQNKTPPQNTDTVANSTKELKLATSNVVKTTVADVLSNTIKAPRILVLHPTMKCNTRYDHIKVQPEHIYNNPYTNPNSDDKAVECLVCKGKGLINGKINM